MTDRKDETGIVLRPARSGEGQSLYEVTKQSVQELAKNHYKSAQLAGWMGERTASYYEDMIERGRTVIAEEGGEILGFVDSDPGEVTRLFLLPGAAGRGLGRRLLEIGVENATKGHSGPIKVESTLNAQGFYERHGFRAVERGYFSHGLGGEPIEIILMELASE